MNKLRISQHFKRILSVIAAQAVVLSAGTYLSGIAQPSGGSSSVKVYQDFENYPNTQESGFVSVLMPTTQPDQVISGKASGIVNMTGTTNDYQNGMWQIGYRLEAQTTYTLTFKYKVIAAESGTRFYMLARSDSVGFTDDRYIFFGNSNDPYDRSDSGDWYNFNIIDKGSYRHLRFTFTNNDKTDRYLMWGVNGTGCIAIDDVMLETGAGGISNDVLSPIAQSAAQTSTTQDFEQTLTDPANFTLTKNGQATLTQENSINGAVSLQGKSGGEWTFAQTNPSQVPLQPWGIHTVTFKMKKIGDLSSGEFYHFTAMSPTGRGINGYSNDRYFRWNNDGVIFEAGTGQYASLEQLRCFVEDKGAYWFVKLTFYIDDFSDYVLQWGLYSQDTTDAMVVDDVRVFYGKDYSWDVPVKKSEPSPSYAFSFEDGVTAGLTLLNGSLANTSPDLINGSVSYKAQTQPGTQWQPALATNKSSVALNSNSYYTVTLRLKNMAATDGYYQLALCTDEHSQDSVVRILGNGQDAGSFNLPKGYTVTAEANGVYLLTATFQTGSLSGYRFEVNIYNGGSLVMDDLLIYEGQFAGTAPVLAVDEKPLIPILTERFEQQDSALWSMNPLGGSLGYRQSEVLNGSYSYVAKHIGGEYYTSLESRSTALTFQPDTVYTVQFRYRVLSSSGLNGSFMFAAKTEQGGYLNDRFVRFTPGGAAVEGVGNNVDSFTASAKDGYVDVAVTFTTGSFTDYRLIFTSVVEGDWAIDDIRVFQGAFCSEDEEPSVQLVTVQPLYTERIESPDLSNSPFVWNTGRITHTAGTIINGSYSYRLTATPDAYGYCIPLVSNATKTTFESGKTYTVRLRYQAVTKTPEDYVIVAFRSSQGDAYVKLRTDGTKIEGNERVFFTENRGSYYDLTATFTLGSASGYEFAVVFQNRPEIIVDDLEIYEGFLYNEPAAVSVTVPDVSPLFIAGFEQNDTTSGLLLKPYGGSYIYNSDSVIDGGYSYQAKGVAGDVWTRSLESSSLQLTPNATYTVTMQFTQAQMKASGAYFQLGLRTEAGGPTNDQYIRFLQDGTAIDGNYRHVEVTEQQGIYSIAVTFMLKNYYDYQLAFVVYNQADVVVDNFAVFTGALFVWDAGRTVETAAPQLVYDESFENPDSPLLSLKAGSYVIGQPKLINGSTSLAVKAHPDAYGYTIAATSKADKLTLQGKGVYTVQWRYRITEALAPDGFAMLALRTESGGPLNDQYVRFTASQAMLEGNAIAYRVETQDNTVVMTATFALNNFNDYSLSLLFYGAQGEMTVDDIRIFRGAAAYAVSAAVPSPETAEQIETRLVQSEGFEDIGAETTLFYVRQGAIVYTEDSIVNGSFSLAMKALSPNQWMDGIVSNADTLTLQPNTTYSVVFRFREWIPSTNGGFIQLAARQIGGNGLQDSYVRFATSGSYVEGNAAYALVHQNESCRTSVFTFTTTSSLTELVFSAFSEGGIYLDDIAVYRGVTYAYSTSAPVVVVPRGEVDAGDYQPPAVPGSIYDKPDLGDGKGNQAGQSDEVSFDGYDIAPDPYTWTEEVVNQETVEKQEPYDEVVEHAAVIKKILRRHIPKTINGGIVIGLGSGAVVLAGIVTTVILLKRKKKSTVKAQQDTAAE